MSNLKRNEVSIILWTQSKKELNRLSCMPLSEEVKIVSKSKSWRQVLKEQYQLTFNKRIHNVTLTSKNNPGLYTLSDKVGKLIAELSHENDKTLYKIKLIVRENFTKTVTTVLRPVPRPMFLPAKVELNEDGRRLKWEGVISVEAALGAVSALVIVKRETIDDNDEVEWLDENGKSVVIKNENEMMDVDMPLDVQPVVVVNSEDVGAVIIHKSEPLDLDCDVNLDNMENNNGDENVPDTNSTETTETSVPLIVKVESMAGQVKKETMEEVENNGNVQNHQSSCDIVTADHDSNLQYNNTFQDAIPISSRAIKTEVFREVEKIPPIVQKIIVLKKGTVDDNVAFLNILKLVGKLPRKVILQMQNEMKQMDENFWEHLLYNAPMSSGILRRFLKLQ